MKLLLDHGADINLQKYRNSSSLLLTSFTGCSKIVELAFTNFPIQLRASLVCSSDAGHVENFKLLLSRGAEVNILNDDGTPLPVACLAGCSDAVKLLIEYGAQVNEPHSGLSALMVASAAGHPEIGIILLKHGAKVNGVSALMMVSLTAGRNSTEPSLPNVTGGIYFSDFLKSDLTSYTKAVELLFNHGADVDIQNDDSVTPLIAASLAGHAETVKLLLEYGANPNLLITTDSDSICSDFCQRNC